VKDEGGILLLENRLLSARIDKRKGTLVSLRREGLELLGGGSGYWSVTGGSEGARVQSLPAPARAEIVKPGGEIGEVAVECPHAGSPGTWPVNASLHYALEAGGESLYVYGCLEHPAGM